MLIKPRRLEPGDTIGIASPASPPPDPKNIDRSIDALEKLGFKPKLAPNARKRLGFLAGTDRERAGDLMRLFLDRQVKAILCQRGGYGAARLLPLLDYKIIRENPKIFVGFSDVTSLHCAFLVKSNLLSFHGPMLNSHFIRRDTPEFTVSGFLRTLARPDAPGSICAGYHKKTVRVLRRGITRGPLVGGNLSLLVTTIGTPWQPEFRGRILFLEDIGEVPYRVDRMLTHLLNCGLLQQVAGIAIGINADCKDPGAKGAGEYRQTIDDVLEERLLPLKIPVVSGLPFGHVPCNATLPVGARAILDAENGDLLFPDAAVS